MDTWNSPATWMQFVTEAIEDIRAGQRFFSRASYPIIVLVNRWESANAGHGKRKCIANDN